MYEQLKKTDNESYNKHGDDENKTSEESVYVLPEGENNLIRENDPKTTTTTPGFKEIANDSKNDDDKDYGNYKIKIDEDDGDDHDVNGSNTCFSRILDCITGCLSRNRQSIRKTIKVLLVLLYLTYFGYCMNYSFGDGNSIILLVITLSVILKISINKLSPRIPPLSPSCLSSLQSKRAKRWRKIIRYFLYVAATCAFGAFLGIEVFKDHPQNIQSLVGIGAFILACIPFSTAPRKIKWHPVFWGFLIQLTFGSLTLRTQTGYELFKWLGDQIIGFLAFSDNGATFVLGPNFATMGLAFRISGMIIFFNSIIFLLNHVGAIEFVVLKLGMFLHYCLDTGPVESVIAAANIFIGLAEAPLLIRPYLPSLTKSELCAVMTCGFASIAGTAIVMFISLGAPANHLLTAAIISSPSALAITKILCPETENPDYGDQKNIKMNDSKKNSNILQACSEGALASLPILGAIIANMISFKSILGLIDAVLQWLGERAGFEGITFDFLCSYALFPVSYAMGVPVADCGMVGSLIGIKLFATPMIGFTTLGEMIENRHQLDQYVETNNGSWHWSGNDVFLEATNTTLVRGFMSVRAEVIATYAMCGFSAFTAIGICLGSLIPLCPSRKDDVIRMVLLAFLGGNVASFATGSVAGMMYTGV